jgi:hypothetical protein
MTIVTPKQFMQLLNNALHEYREQNGRDDLPEFEFTDDQGGYTWPARHLDASRDGIYSNIANKILSDYRTN